jgi:putative phage-type endonuclease
MIEQGTPEWHALRCGKLTSSRIADIVRRTRNGFSATRERCLGDLVAERLSGVQAPGFESPDMRWGKEHEASAIALYAFMHDASPEKVAFVDHPTIAMAGASPDRRVGADGLVEAKCPATHTHIATLRGGAIDSDYLTQMQWQMACDGRQWCDWLSYDPRMPEDMRLVVRRVRRDEVRIAELEAAARVFLAEVDEAVADLMRLYRSPLAVAAE